MATGRGGNLVSEQELWRGYGMLSILWLKGIFWFLKG